MVRAVIATLDIKCSFLKNRNYGIDNVVICFVAVIYAGVAAYHSAFASDSNLGVFTTDIEDFNYYIFFFVLGLNCCPVSSNSLAIQINRNFLTVRELNWLFGEFYVSSKLNAVTCVENCLKISLCSNFYRVSCVNRCFFICYMAFIVRAFVSDLENTLDNILDNILDNYIITSCVIVVTVLINSIICVSITTVTCVCCITIFGTCGRGYY